MSEPRDERSDQPMDRAAELGEQAGRFAIVALQRIEATVREATPSQPLGEPTKTGAEPAGTSDPSATERAEEILDGLGERLGQLVSLAGPRIRKLAALAREEAEDIWAEAQHIRGANESSQSESGAETPHAQAPPHAG